jgi:hypothetical protein
VVLNGGTYNILLYDNFLNVDKASAKGWWDPTNSTWHRTSNGSWYLGNPFFSTGHVVDDKKGTGAHYDDAGPLNPFHAIFAIWGLSGGGQETKYTCSVSGGCQPVIHP